MAAKKTTTPVLRCRPGDIARIIASDGDKRDIGKLVLVVRAATDADSWTPEDAWNVQSLGAPFHVRYYSEPPVNGRGDYIVKVERACTYADSHLMPIRPSLEPELSNAKVKAPVKLHQGAEHV